METAVTDSDSPIREIFTRQPDNPSVVVVDGYGIRIHVQRGHLVIQDGIGRTRRTRKIPRIDGAKNARSNLTDQSIARLIILSDTGYVTLEALRWCADLSISVVQLDRTGRILMCSPGLTGDARLRIAQVKAQDTATGLDIIRALIAAKLTGQAAVLREVFNAETSALRIERMTSDLAASPNLKSILAIEGSAAGIYWRAWRGNVHVPFAPQDLEFVPAHWYSFKNRASVRNPQMQGKNATDVINAMLNYSYSICENEARYACHVLGLDPAIGYGHGHTNESDTLVFDLMEVLRPEADRVVLSLMDTGLGVPYRPDGKRGYLKVLWFTESRDGVCRLTAPVTHMLAELIPAAVASIAGQYAEQISRALVATSKHRVVTSRYIHEASPARLTVVKPPRLAGDLVPADVLSDAAWSRVAPLIPPEPVSTRHKRTPRSDNRLVLAGILCHESLGVAWRGIPASFGVNRQVCRRRLTEWQSLGAWETIYAAAKPGR